MIMFADLVTIASSASVLASSLLYSTVLSSTPLETAIGLWSDSLCTRLARGTSPIIAHGPIAIKEQRLRDRTSGNDWPHSPSFQLDPRPKLRPRCKVKVLPPRLNAIRRDRRRMSR